MGEYLGKRYFISAIGTNCGKTLASAVLCEALRADYWKPIQAGISPQSDTELVKSLVSNKKTVFHKEAYKLKEPVSPHLAAHLENKVIDLSKINCPETHNTLIIEGAGGLLVSLNQKDFVYDLIPHLNAELILIVNFYLGSINHTLLTIEYLKNRKTMVKGIIYSGEINRSSADIIEINSPWPVLGCIEQMDVINKSSIKQQANKLKLNFKF
jgi:dethiobiotin synthetase